jgi:hypothetical protein
MEKKMLVDEPRVLRSHPILSMIAAMNGNYAVDQQISEGVYQVGHFGSSDFLRDGYEDFPDLGEHSEYGVCDDLENLMDVLGDTLRDPKRRFVVTLTPVQRDPNNKGKGGGWRWHKWGPYIGAFEPQHEYLDDEEGIDCVYCYRVYEQKIED